MVGKRKSPKHFLRKYLFGKKSKRKAFGSETNVELSDSESIDIGETSSMSHVPLQPAEKYELNGDSSPAKPDYGSFQVEPEDVHLIENVEEEDEEKEKEEMDQLAPSNFAVDEELLKFPQIDTRRLSFFRDGTRRIDFVLVYEIKKSTKQEEIEKWREKFENNLRKAGLEMEKEVLDTESSIHFIKLTAPWNVLVEFAEELSFRAPLQMHPHPTINWSEMVMSKLHIPNICKLDVPNKPVSYFTCSFKKTKMDKFLGIENQEEFFTPVQRSQVVYEILRNASYGKRRKGEIGIERLIKENVYNAAFPLHDGPYQKPDEEFLPEELNRRQILYEYWAKWGRWYKYQPLDHIREYFGEKIAIYFAWLGFYTAWLLPPSVVGFLVFVYGLCTFQSDVPTNEICQSGNHYKMCPLCEEKEQGCNYWNLSDTCIFAKIGYLFDQSGTVFYSVFIAFWAVSYLEYWKRKSISLAYHWDCMDFEEEEERPRAEFSAKAPISVRNPVTGAKEPAFPKPLRFTRMTAGAGVLLFMVSMVVVFVIAVIVYRLLVTVPLFQFKPFRGVAPVIASMTGACINLLFIMIMGRFYENIAAKLTDWEMHRTQTEYESNLTVKVFVFQFVNFYSSIFYIAFFKGRFAGFPGHYHKIFGMRAETCGNNGCFIELAQQLAVIMIGKQIINNIQEIVIPKLKTWWHQKRTKLDHDDATVTFSRWHDDYKMISNEGLFQEYLEMVLQFGFITIFVAAFPLAPLFALLNNWVEIRLDAHKFVCETRRSVAERAQNIGIWFTILEILAHVAVISNAFLISFTSQFLPKLLYTYHYNDRLHGFVNHSLAWAPNGTLSQSCRYIAYRDQNGNLTTFYWQLLALRLGFVLIFEHVVFGICRLIDVLVPDIPESLDLKIKRERYLAKQALTESEAIMELEQLSEDEEEKGSPKKTEI